MKRVLVTGSRGFIGRRVVSLLKRDYEIIELEQGEDISKEGWIEKTPLVDAVIHLAAVAPSSSSAKHAHMCYKVNVLGTINVLEYCQRHGAKLIFASSFVYSKSLTPASEADLPDPSNLYTESKRIAEECIKGFSKLHKIPSIILRFANVYGPGQKSSFLIPRIISQIKEKDNIELFSPYPKRDFIFVDDIVSAIHVSLKHPIESTDIFNVGSGKSHSVAEIVGVIKEISQKEVTVSYTKARKEDMKDSAVLNIDKIQRVLGWEPETSLLAGLEKTYEK